MRNLILPILFILCLSFQASALGPMSLMSGMGTGLVHDLDMETGGAITTVPNAGSAGDWECNPANTLADFLDGTTFKEGSYSYDLRAANEYIIAQDNNTSTTFRVTFWWRPDLEADNLRFFGMGNADATQEAGEIILRQLWSSPDITLGFTAEKSGTGDVTKNGTDVFAVDTWYCLGFDVDTNSGGTIAITGKYATDVTTCEWESEGSWTGMTFGSWSTNPDAIATPAAPFHLGIDASLESDCRIDGFRAVEY